MHTAAEIKAKLGEYKNSFLQALPTQEIKQHAQRFKKIFVFIIIIIVAVLVVKISIAVVRAFKKPANAKYVTGGGDIPQGWDPTQVTDDLYHAIDGTFVSSDTKDEAFKEFNDLNDNQMIDVYNDWKKRYYSDKAYYMFPYGTLTNAIKNKWGYVSITGENNKDIALANLERLKLP